MRLGSGQKPEGEEEKGQAADQMSPNVARLGVHRQDGFETNRKAGQWWPMPGVQKLIVLQPIGQRVEILHCPRGLPSLQNHLNSLVNKWQNLLDKMVALLGPALLCDFHLNLIKIKLKH